MSLVFAIAIMSSQQQSFSWGVLPLRIRVQGQTFPSLRCCGSHCCCCNVCVIPAVAGYRTVPCCPPFPRSASGFRCANSECPRGEWESGETERAQREDLGQLLTERVAVAVCPACFGRVTAELGLWLMRNVLKSLS